MFTPGRHAPMFIYFSQYGFDFHLPNPRRCLVGHCLKRMSAGRAGVKGMLEAQLELVLAKLLALMLFVAFLTTFLALAFGFFACTRFDNITRGRFGRSAGILFGLC